MTFPYYKTTGFVVLDASVWVSRLVPQDAFHQAVKTWMEDQRKANVQLISPAFMLAEVGGAITRRTGNPILGRQVISQLEKFPGIRLIEMNNLVVELAASLAVEYGLRGADSIYVAVAHQLNVPLVTLDVDQGERATKIVSVLKIV